MRIVSGIYGGRIIDSPHSFRTHPMSEKIRGALFNALGDLDGMTVLDAFTGSGAVAIEAVSRGAEHVIAIDNDLEAYKCAVNNVRKLDLEETVSVVRINAKSWSNRSTDKLFDIVIADPPFDGINDTLLEKIGRHVKNGGILVISMPNDFKPRKNNNFREISIKNYGDATLGFYRRNLK